MATTKSCVWLRRALGMGKAEAGDALGESGTC